MDPKQQGCWEYAPVWLKQNEAFLIPYKENNRRYLVKTVYNTLYNKTGLQPVSRPVTTPVGETIQKSVKNVCLKEKTKMCWKSAQNMLKKCSKVFLKEEKLNGRKLRKL